MTYGVAEHPSLKELEALATGGIFDAETRERMLEHIRVMCDSGSCRRLLDDFNEEQEKLGKRKSPKV